MMFLEKVKEQSLELERQRERNKKLKQTKDELERECEQIANKIIETQVERAEGLESSIILRKELNEEKSSYFRKMQAISDAEKENESLSYILQEKNSSSKNPSMDVKYLSEKLGFRKEMEKCLQDELLEYRLKSAENEAVIRELKITLDELEREVDILKKITPDTVLRIREELRLARCRELAIKMEFENIKRDIGEIKAQSERRKKEKYKGKSTLRKSNSFSKKKRWENAPEPLKSEYESSLANLGDYMEEKKILENEITKIEDQIEQTQAKLQQRDEELKQINATLRQNKSKTDMNNEDFQKRQKLHKDLDENFRDTITHIRKSVSEKVHAFSEFANKLKNLEVKKSEDCEDNCNEANAKSPTESRSRFFVPLD